MNLTRLTFTFDGHTLAVTGYLHPAYAGSLVEPPQPECFSVWKAEIVKQAEPAEPVSVNDLDEDDLAEAALRAWHARDDADRSHYADLRREDRMLESRGYL